MATEKNSEQWFYEMSKIVDEANHQISISMAKRNIQKSPTIPQKTLTPKPASQNQSALQPDVIAALEKLLQSKKLQRGRRE